MPVYITSASNTEYHLTEHNTLSFFMGNVGQTVKVRKWDFISCAGMEKQTTVPVCHRTAEMGTNYWQQNTEAQKHFGKVTDLLCV